MGLKSKVKFMVAKLEHMYLYIHVFSRVNSMTVLLHDVWGETTK